MNPSKPSHWIDEKAIKLLKLGFTIELAEIVTIKDFLDLLHSQGKIEMPDLPKEE